MLDLAHSDRAPLELLVIEETGLDETPSERHIGRTLCEVDGPVVEIHPDLGLDLERDLPGE